MLDIGAFMEEGDEAYKNGLDFNTVACLLYLSIPWNTEDRSTHKQVGIQKKVFISVEISGIILKLKNTY